MSSSITATRRSAGTVRSLSAMRSSSLASNVRENRNRSFSTASTRRSVRATSKNARAYASTRSGCATALPAPVPAAADLLDVTLDQGQLRVAIQVALDDPLRELDRQVRDSPLEVGTGPLGREPRILLRPRPDLGRLGLGLG